MRNKIQLYIGSERADLDNGSFLLLNYTMEELSNPTVVKNMFSCQITLKGTPQNNKIFGGIYRSDRQTQYGGGTVGPDFDPTRKTPFTIYNETHEILESGYLKLDKVTMTKKRIEYAVTLYGSLGSFLYGLAYKTNGEKLTVADLAFPTMLDFTIDKSAVADAWKRLDGDTSVDAKWDIINFIPSYNGLPSGEFSADKAVVHAATCGLPTEADEYSTKDGFALVSLTEKVTGNEAKDYRSYLQKPVIKVSALIDAICDPANNGGYTVNKDAEFFADTNPYWKDSWITLPKMQDLNIDVADTYGQDNFNGGTHTIPGGGVITKLYNIWVDFALVGWGGNTDYKLDCEDDWAAGMQGNDNPGYYLNYLDWEVIAYDANDNIIKQYNYRVSTRQAPANEIQMDDTFDYIAGGYTFMKNGQVWKPTITIQEYGVAKVSINMTYKSISWGNLRAAADPQLMWPTSSYNYNDGVFFSCDAELQGSYIKYNIINSSTVRTGATIPSSALLSGGNTPADYLLSYCKMFGLQLVSHKDSKTVDIVLRKNFYNQTTANLSGRIDRGKQIVKTPFAFDARWYLWGNDAKGDYAEYYAAKYGRPYGQYRVNTGYEFDATEKRLTDGIVFGNACPVVETSKYFCDLTLNALPVPSLFIGGGKYTLYKGDDTKDFDLPSTMGATKIWDDITNPMHDEFAKMQFHGKDNATIDERDTLVFFNGMATPSSAHLSLTDDTRAMMQLNGNSPCWLPGYCDYDATCKLTKIPQFTRYVWSGAGVSKSFDFGDPLESQIPGISFGASSNIFNGYWKKYITDRYDDDSVVLLCNVDLRGMQVNEDLFRRFYAFDGCLWALNRIINHSLATSGTTQCEFVKVQDINNYTTL